MNQAQTFLVNRKNTEKILKNAGFTPVWVKDELSAYKLKGWRKGAKTYREKRAIELAEKQNFML